MFPAGNAGCGEDSLGVEGGYGYSLDGPEHTLLD